MKPETYQHIRKIVKGHSGLELGEDKEYLVRSRFQNLIDKHKMANIDDLVQWLITNNSNWKQIMAEQLATHETYFFRDPVLFDDLRDTIFPLLGAKEEALVWSAACSSGQEIYTVAMMLEMERYRIPAQKFKLMASDFSESALERAREGMYSHYEVQRGLPAKYLINFFTKEENSWQLSSAIRDLVKIFSLNLQLDSQNWPNADLVFLRNVLIYFTLQDRKMILEKMYDSMKKGSFLILGASETLFGVSTKFEKFEGTKSIIYTKR